MGSSVPAWPTLIFRFWRRSNPPMLPRSLPHTSNDVHPFGLSMRRTALSQTERSSGRVPGGTAVGGGNTFFFCFSALSNEVFGDVLPTSDIVDDVMHRRSSVFCRFVLFGIAICERCRLRWTPIPHDVPSFALREYIRSIVN